MRARRTKTATTIEGGVLYEYYKFLPSVVTPKLQQLFLISIPLFIAHGLEEYLTGFYKIDSDVRFVFGWAQDMSSMQAVFLTFQIMFWLTLIVSYLLISNIQWAKRLMFVPGIIFIYELHHLYKAVVVSDYYPGLLTALFFPIIGYFYWSELLRTSLSKKT